MSTNENKNVAQSTNFSKENVRIDVLEDTTKILEPARL